MTPDDKSKPKWTLYAPDQTGKERIAGKFLTDREARDFARRFGVAVWRLKGPNGVNLSS